MPDRNKNIISLLSIVIIVSQFLSVPAPAQQNSVTIDAGKKSENSNPTLIDILGAKGGVVEVDGVYDALCRHAVAALLNAAHPHVSYSMTEQTIINAVKDAIENSDFSDAEPLKNMLEGYNSLGGGIDAHGNPI